MRRAAAGIPQNGIFCSFIYKKSFKPLNGFSMFEYILGFVSFD